MADVKITVRNDGPLRVEGPFTLVDAEGNAYGIAQRQWVSLCRCGLSDDEADLRRRPQEAGLQVGVPRLRPRRAAAAAEAEALSLGEARGSSRRAPRGSLRGRWPVTN